MWPGNKVRCACKVLIVTKFLTHSLKAAKGLVTFSLNEPNPRRTFVVTEDISSTEHKCVCMCICVCINVYMRAYICTVLCTDGKSILLQVHEYT